jgi:hypothetical protein
VCAGTGVDPVELYRWNCVLSMAIFDDIATVEVAVRSAIAHQLYQGLGQQWYRDATQVFDENAHRGINKAWKDANLTQLDRQGVDADVLHGKLVASLMFGFWVKLLGRGGFVGGGVQRVRKIYDSTLWQPYLCHAFPQVGQFDRQKVETAAHQVQWVRNRIAHHEHIIWGTPIPGQNVLLTVSQVHAGIKTLAGYAYPDLEQWLVMNSRVPPLLNDCPLPEPAIRQLKL